jgi:hypothetical protein
MPRGIGSLFRALFERTRTTADPGPSRDRPFPRARISAPEEGFLFGLSFFPPLAGGKEKPGIISRPAKYLLYSRRFDVILLL